ncbi:hypothetical protein AMAG_09892 [Allomyces macrogynus ATCC 38327]|uniref:Uncharacterized protein n=1 Tax=Allomyces macrogynus (strain ATCC 38327) TaxID=578462 RepID=A0A0L0SPX6_ALLM3|nr:hypothetical protein AMAG_09892 [Allomyces macrogynus ATCC 38327]|eukprot:KNE64532.1 hypothetical protein AMAG_09892 [Allomyces macrogynus ATCC 38327]
MAQDLNPPATASPSSRPPAVAQTPTRPPPDNAPGALEEVELMPGVYLVKRPSASSSSSAAPAPAPQSDWECQYAQTLHDLDTESLEGEYRALVTSARHLDRSNREMEEYAAAEEDDAERAELTSIIAENGPVLVRLVQKAHIVRESLTRRGVDVDHLLGTIAVPGTVATTTTMVSPLGGAPAPPAAQAAGADGTRITPNAAAAAQEPDEGGFFL